MPKTLAFFNNSASGKACTKPAAIPATVESPDPTGLTTLIFGILTR